MGKLVTCATCGGSVSTNASSCPHCGEKSFRRRMHLKGLEISDEDQVVESYWKKQSK